MLFTNDVFYIYRQQGKREPQRNKSHDDRIPAGVADIKSWSSYRSTSSVVQIVIWNLFLISWTYRIAVVGENWVVRSSWEWQWCLLLWNNNSRCKSKESWSVSGNNFSPQKTYFLQRPVHTTSSLVNEKIQLVEHKPKSSNLSTKICIAAHWL